MSPRHHRLGPIAAAAAVMGVFTAGLGGCDLLSPEFEVRNLIDRAAGACTRRDAPALGALVAENYSDSAGHYREEALHRIKTYLLIHRSLHCFTQVARVELRGDRTAQAEVYAAFADQPIDSAADVQRVSAQAFHLWVDFAPDQEHRLLIASTRSQRIKPAEWPSADRRTP